MNGLTWIHCVIGMLGHVDQCGAVGAAGHFVADAGCGEGHGDREYAVAWEAILEVIQGEGEFDPPVTVAVGLPEAVRERFGATVEEMRAFVGGQSVGLTVEVKAAMRQSVGHGADDDPHVMGRGEIGRDVSIPEHHGKGPVAQGNLPIPGETAEVQKVEGGALVGQAHLLDLGGIQSHGADLIAA